MPKWEIVTVRKLLCDQTLAIPSYQRPYKWTRKNVNQLFADIADHQRDSKGTSAYRLGTVVFHRDGDQRNIVDGQQRIITLLLAVRALREKGLAQGMDGVFQPSVRGDESRVNVYHNYQEIRRIISRSDCADDMADFILDCCELVTFELSDVSEAFQFFDSQNARGKDLEPHDLLKAYHLREFGAGEEELMADKVAQWEDTDTEELRLLFARYLYRIRRWCRGDDAGVFDKDDIHVFKGVRTDQRQPYAELLRMAHAHVDEQRLGFPFQLDQAIINGRRFFEMISHYQGQAGRLADAGGAAGLSDTAQHIMKELNSFRGRGDTGNAYVRQLFDCLLLYYMDRFGQEQLSLAVEKIFVWAYSLRLKRQSVKLASMDKHVRENNLFKVLRDAVHPEDFLNCHVPPVGTVLWKHGAGVQQLFRNMGYIHA